MELQSGAVEDLDISNAFWRGRKVLVTGHTGFKGGWLSHWLQHSGAEIVGVALDPPTNPNLFESSGVADGMLSLRQDIRDGDEMKRILADNRPEIVFHLAAQPLVRYSYRAPVETFETNVMGTLHILEAIRNIDTVRAAVMVTTDKCYENREWEWGYREDEPMGGHDPYSSSKAAAELLIASYRKSYFPVDRLDQHGTAIASVRAGNVIGGGDWAEDRLVPDIVRGFIKNECVTIRNPRAIRPWQHVLEPLGGYLLLAERLVDDGAAYAQAWNFGPQDHDARTVRWIVEFMAEQWGEGARWTIDERDDVHEATYLKLDCAKAHARLGWWPKWDLHAALAKVIEWHKAELRLDDLKSLCAQQIDEYTQCSTPS